MALVNPLQSPRFCGIRSFMRMPVAYGSTDADVVVLGIPFDSATSYRPGARFGPAAIREAYGLVGVPPESVRIRAMTVAFA